MNKLNLVLRLQAFSVIILLFLGALSSISAQEQPQPKQRWVRWRLIEVGRKSLADSILAQLQQGVSFQKLARRYSLHASAKEGGEMGWATLDSVNNNFKTAMASLPIGGTSVILQNGNHPFVLQKLNDLANGEYMRWKKQRAEVDSVLKEAEELLNTGNSPAALTLIENVEELVKQIEDEGVNLKLLYFKGWALSGLSQFTEAMSFFEAALEISRATRNGYWETRALGQLGNLNYYVGEYQNAFAFYDSALSVAQKIGDREREEVQLGNIAAFFLAWGQIQQAIIYSDSALVIARAIEDQLGEVIQLGNLGRAYTELGEFKRAIEYYESSLHMAREIGNEKREQIQLGNLGAVYDASGQTLRAVAYYDSSLTIARKLGDRMAEGVWLGSLGSAYFALGQYQKSIAFCNSALAIAREIGDQGGESVHLNILGIAYYELGQYQRAIVYADSSLRIARKIGDKSKEGGSLGELGNAYHALSLYDRAIAYYDSVLVIVREIGDLQAEAIWLGNSGMTHSSLGQYANAFACLDSALVIARSIGDRGGEETYLGNIASVYNKQGQYRSGLAYADSALSIAEEIADAEGIWQWRWLLAQTRSQIPEFNKHEVVASYDNAISALEDITGQLVRDEFKLSFLKNKQELYQEYINYLMGQTEDRFHKRALEISEASRTRALRDLLQGQRVQAPLAVEKRVSATKRTEELFQKFADVQVARADLNNVQRAGGIDSLEAWASQILIPADTLGSTEGAPAIRMREIEAAARTNTLLEYHVLDDGVAIWVVSQSGKVFSFKQNIPKAKLQALIDSARQALGVAGLVDRNVKPVISSKEPRTAAYKPVLQTLDSLLILPVAQHLPADSSRELIILPHDMLFLLPFACLIDSSGKYLSERYSFSTAPSVGLLKFTSGRAREQQDRESPKLLLMGNPAMPDAKIWPPLPGAEQEVKRIAQNVNQKKGAGFQIQGALPLQALPLVKAKATEAEFRQIASVQNYLHLATHGYVVSDALRSGLILAKTGNTMETDGILTTAEIFGLPLNAELVVLSACQTGLGQISSDGVAGMSRAFLYAGAASLMVSLWKVDDAATQFLMVKFYEELARDGNKARALRAAQLSTMKKYPAPSDWAAFVLVGQPR